MPANPFKATKTRDIVVPRQKLKSHRWDIGGRDFLIAFNEPAFRFSKKNLPEADLDAKLNARLPSYFLPTVAVAEKQPKRPRMFIVSGLNMALKWNAKSDRQQTIMLINNRLKLDFLRTFFETFFPDSFSIIEYIVSQDPLKMSDDQLLMLWRILERRYPEQISGLKLTLAKYKRPQLFNAKELSKEAETFLDSQNEELLGAFKYAVAHLFLMADISFEGNYVHNPLGYLTIGGPNEKNFNIIRELALQVLQDIAELVFEQNVIYKDNIRLIIETQPHVPVPYNGYFRSYGNDKLELAEVTYENGESLDFYDQYDKLKPDMEYIYEFIPKERYQAFWLSYQDRYFELKQRYREAYKLAEDF
ncbi:MAG TPA: hypothetical protein VIJ68_04635 [Candidatus Saccharimonadales bacterium]